MGLPSARLAVFVLTRCAPVLAGAVVFAGMALAQKVISAKSGLILFVQGRVSVDGGGLDTGARPLPLKSGNLYRQLKGGERVSTQRGRAEILLNPGTVLRLGDISRMRMDEIKITDACVSLESGAAVVTVNYIPKNDRIRLVVGGSDIVLKKAGVYRFDLGRFDLGRVDSGRDSTQARMRVFSGLAEVRRAGSSTVVRVKRGQAVTLDDNLEVAKFDLKDSDALQLWASARTRATTPRTLGIRPQPPPIGLASEQGAAQGRRASDRVDTQPARPQGSSKGGDPLVSPPVSP